MAHQFFSFRIWQILEILAGKKKQVKKLFRSLLDT